MVRCPRTDPGLSQQLPAIELDILAGYLNLIPHDRGAVTSSPPIELAETLRVDLGDLLGTRDRQPETGLRGASADLLLGADGIAPIR